MRRRSGLVIALIAGCAIWPAVAPAQTATPAEIAAMKEMYKRAPAPAVQNQALVDLGRLLFWDPRVSESGKTACATCHLPYLGWAVTDARSRDDSGSPDVAQIAAADRDGTYRKFGIRLGRPRADAGGADSQFDRRPDRCRCARDPPRSR